MACLLGGALLLTPMQARAAQAQTGQALQSQMGQAGQERTDQGRGVQGQQAPAQAEIHTRTSYVAAIQAPEAAVYASADSNSPVRENVRRGEICDVLSWDSEGWLRVRTAEGTGYIPKSKASVIERTSQRVDRTARKRRQVVEYALGFVGNPYAYGGSDPNSGVDCSGFTRYVMEKAAAISLPHSSRGQAGCGREITQEEMRQGDLLFYGGETGINHVAMYIGGGQVVHASTEATGIKTSPYDYREPVRIVSLLADSR